MTNLQISDLFTNERLSGGLEFGIFLIYAPLGFCLFTVRVFIGIQAYLINMILPKCSIYREVVMRVLCAVLGIMVSVKQSTAVPSSNQNPSPPTISRRTRAKVLVANYISTLDHLAINLIIPNVLPSVWDLPPVLMYFLGYKDMETKKGRQHLINNAIAHVKTPGSLPLLSFPEGGSTNGLQGLLRFSVWPFSLNEPVQPVLIKLSRPLLSGVAPCVLGGRWWMDIFWFLFVPVTFFEIRLAPVQSQRMDESYDEFTARVQHYMANQLRLVSTCHTSSDKVEYAKRTLFAASAASTSAGLTAPSLCSAASSSKNDARNVAMVTPTGAQEKMARSIQAVLPNVPLDVIQADLAITKDIDLTITNFLEGRVTFTPLEIKQPLITPRVQSDSTAPDSNGTSPMIKIAAKQFPKTSSQRHLSLQQRKDLLFDNARQRFIEKNGPQRLL